MNELLANVPVTNNSKSVSLISTCNSTDTWTINNVIPMVPVIITASSSNPNWEKNKCASIVVTNGSIYNQNVQITLGANSGYDRSGTCTIIPSDENLVINVTNKESTVTLYAFQ